MRILVISNYYPPLELGGWEQLTSNVVCKLRERGHAVTVLTSNYRKMELKSPEDGIYRLLHLESYDPLNYHPMYSLVKGVKERENLRHLKAMIEVSAAEIIFINGMWNLPHSLAQGAEAMLPGKVVYYLASYWPTEADAHTSYWTDMNVDPRLRAFKKLAGSILRKTMLRSVPRNRLQFPLVLCVSSYVRDYAVQEAGIPKERTRIVHNGIELDMFAMKPRAHRGDNRVRLIYAGRLAPDKGVHTLLEALALLKERKPEARMSLSIYGQGAPDYHRKLNEIIEANQLEDWVRFGGLVPRERMPEVLASHDILVFPSIWSEPLARILQEAMASGLAVIGTATGGTGEILIHEETGLVFEAGNAEMLADQIARMVEDRSLRHELAQAGRRLVEEKFSLDRMVDEIETNFQCLLNDRE